MYQDYRFFLAPQKEKGEVAISIVEEKEKEEEEEVLADRLTRVSQTTRG